MVIGRDAAAIPICKSGRFEKLRAQSGESNVNPPAIETHLNCETQKEEILEADRQETFLVFICVICG